MRWGSLGATRQLDELNKTTAVAKCTPPAPPQPPLEEKHELLLPRAC